MICWTPDCGRKAHYRTTGSVLVLLCLKHMEFALELDGFAPEDLVSLPNK